MKVLCVIPARYASTRLPGKPLAMIAGKPMIQRVYEQAVQAYMPEEVVVATDSEKVAEVVEAFGGHVILTSPDHPSGTDRLAEVALSYNDIDVIINVQGDEPMIPPEVIDKLAQAFVDDEDLNMATLKTLMNEEDYHNPNAVKVVTDQNGYALYFSRSLLPYPRKKTVDFKVYKHIGIYAYRRNFLLSYAAYEPTPLEEIEGLEQLRALENGQRIKVIECKFNGIGIDTQEDLDAVNKLFAQK
ncbi:MAG TPA: 3-deoxy-manno-octulosonate cytidylyltransferase [Candidatus Avacidaminococcus intestinavium]|uniref:3-deoxy-manno-octulosonate cytidylyltransferase n=1 Tax=Candidatus Avacidaminococcus intestinavium TaxID=2840684 RepID=A0A9D1MPE3_9FIRM|nr:3-deoxy-manno-octulosonate cytidylyltransferase [Candidatus Avacidaminococcus intestinavium]